ncbi:MAG: NrsF family protein [Burkholderiaceae bacterium]
MKTDDLIDWLAHDAPPVPRRAVPRRLGAGVALGLAGAAVLMAAVFGLRPELARMAAEPMFWGKLAYVTAVAAVALALLWRLGRPGARVGAAPWALALPVGLMAWAAFATLWQALPGERMALVLGSTWRTCPFNIALLSLPALGAALWALRGAAPTRLPAAGAAAGLLAGALGALAYALHCPELQAPFLLVWYLAGMAVPTVVGGWLGPRVLRW